MLETYPGNGANIILLDNKVLVIVYALLVQKVGLCLIGDILLQIHVR